MQNQSREESRGRRSSSNRPPLPIVGSSSSSSSRFSSVEGGFSRHPPSQHIVIRDQRKSTQSKEPHHENPEKDETNLLLVYSKRDKTFTKIHATVVNDIDESWISKDLVERFELNHSLEDKPRYGHLGKKTFQFYGIVELQWIEKGKSKYTKCHIVPDKSFEVYLHCSQWHPASPRERSLIVPDPLPTLLPPALNEISPSTTNHSAAMAGSFDGDRLAEALDDRSKESIWADKWMSDLEANVHKYIKKPLGYLRDNDNPPVKIAVLDTGVDSKNPFIRGARKANRIKALKSFVKTDESTEDGVGHGTHVAALLLNVAPDAQIYIAKVAQDENIPSDHNIAEAIKWAVEFDVDIITMSFGLENDHACMQKEILEAYSKDIIIFAAASNNGGNYEVTYPARKNEVICIYSTDGNGNTSPCNPPHLKNSAYHFATLGVGVKSGLETERRMTGTSFSTPIAAGIAACILEFARMHKIEGDLYKVLRSRQGMQEVFAQHLVDKRDELHYLNPWKLFAKHRSEEEIFLQIKDPLKRWVGNTEKETEMR